MTQTNTPKTTDEFLKAINADYYKLNYKKLKQEAEELIQIHCYGNLLDLINRLNNSEITEQFLKCWQQCYKKQNFKDLLEAIKSKTIFFVPYFEKEFEQLDKYHHILNRIKQIEIKEREREKLTKKLIMILIAMPIVLFSLVLLYIYLILFFQNIFP